MLTSVPRGSQSLNQSVVRMFPKAADKFLIQGLQVCHPGGQSGHGNLCSVS